MCPGKPIKTCSYPVYGKGRMENRAKSGEINKKLHGEVYDTRPPKMAWWPDVYAPPKNVGDFLKEQNDFRECQNS